MILSGGSVASTKNENECMKNLNNLLREHTNALISRGGSYDDLMECCEMMIPSCSGVSMNGYNGVSLSKNTFEECCRILDTVAG